MSNQYAIIYFIHDDIGIRFEGLLQSNILQARIPTTIKAYLIFNKRVVKPDHVEYISEVSEIVTTDASSTTLNNLSTFTIWQDAFLFVFVQLKQLGLHQKVGMIALSHSAGIVINRNGEKLPVIVSDSKNKNLVTKLRGKTRTEDNRYIVKPANRGTVFVNTKTVVNLSEKNNSQGKIFRKRYLRTPHIGYCRNYEGLFTFQLSKFFSEEELKFEFIIFSNCNIQVYDNGFLFAPITNFTIGAESNNNLTTWDFPTIINTMAENLTVPPLSMLKEIFKSCIQHFSTISSDITYRYFLTGSDNFNLLHQQFEKIIIAITQEIKSNPSFKKGLLRWLKDAEATNSLVPLFDVVKFFSIANNMSGNKLATDMQLFSKQLQNIVIARNSNDPNYCGFSLYLPRNKQSFDSTKGGICNYFNPENQNEFIKNSEYETFLISLFQ